MGASVMKVRPVLFGGVSLAPILLSWSIATHAADAAEAERKPTIDEVLVVGSRVIVDGTKAPTPVTVLTTEDLAIKSPGNIPDALRQLPAFMDSSGPSQAGAAFQSSTVGPSPGQGNIGTYLNLRALGNNRMLMLQDGHRVPASTSTGQTDASLFPQMLVQRVDVITGGTSAVYGSDGITGAVNFVTDSKFEGLKTNIQGGLASRGDMQSFRFGVAGGIGLLDERLHLIGSAELYRNDGIRRQDDRPLGGEKDVTGYSIGGKNSAVNAGTAANPYVIYSGTRSTSDTFPGIILSGPLKGNEIIGGQLVPYNLLGTPINNVACINCPDNYRFNGNAMTLVPEQSTSQLFTRATFDVSDQMSAWAQVSYASSRSVTYTGTDFFHGNITIFKDNAFLPPAVVAAMGDTTSFTFGKDHTEDEIPTPKNDYLNTAFTVLAGLEGSFGEKWHWDVTYAYGQTHNNSSSGEAMYPNSFASFDAVRDPATGNIVCNVTLTDPGRYPGCVPFNLFSRGRNETTAAAGAYIMGTSIVNQELLSNSFEANLRDEPFSTWAGPVIASVGAAYRRQTYDLVSNSGPGSYDNGGIRGLGSTLLFNVINTTPSDGSQSVTEGYGEVNIPLLADKRLFKSVDMDAAIRVTDYDTSGTVETWKVGLNWQLNDDIRFRGTVSRDIRAPSVGELFAGQSTAPFSLDDTAHGAGRYPVTAIIGGNTNLEPEKSDDLTAGVVYTPGWLDGFRVSVDYYQYKLSDAISNPYTVQQLVDICETSGGTDSLCNQIVRPLPFNVTGVDNRITTIYNIPVNVTKFTVAGFDLEAGYSRAVGDGRLSARLIGNYLDRYEQISAPGAATRIFAGNADGFGGLPRTRVSLDMAYTVGAWMFGITENYIGHLKHSLLPTAVWDEPYVSAQYYTNLNVAYDFERSGGNVQIFANAQNVFDRAPPIVPATGPFGGYPTLYNLYDMIGAQFTVGARMRF